MWGLSHVMGVGVSTLKSVYVKKSVPEDIPKQKMNTRKYTDNYW